MLRLSQRAWNNVIIVIMLMLIILFNLSADFINVGDDETSFLFTLVPVNMTITTIQFDQEKVERIGQGWRTKSGMYSNQRLANLVENWLNAEIDLFDQEANWQSSTSTVKIWFAGQVLPIEYQFMQLPDKTLVKVDKQTYQLIIPSYKMLTLSE